MRFGIPLLSLLLLATAAPAEEPAESDAPASPQALAALESRLGVAQDRLERDHAGSLEHSLRKMLAKRIDDGLTHRIAPPASVPASRAPVPASEQAESSPMTCAMVNGMMDCRLVASIGAP